MAEREARQRQYDYRAVSLSFIFVEYCGFVVTMRLKVAESFLSSPLLNVQNSNLVLTAETRTREAAEPSGEPESLHGRMRGKMGDRVQHSKPEGYEERKQKHAKKRQAQQEFELEAPKQKRRVCWKSASLSSKVLSLVMHTYVSCTCVLSYTASHNCHAVGWWRDES